MMDVQPRYFWVVKVGEHLHVLTASGDEANAQTQAEKHWAEAKVLGKVMEFRQGDLPYFIYDKADMLRSGSSLVTPG